METRTPSSLKWLVDKRARLAGLFADSEEGMPRNYKTRYLFFVQVLLFFTAFEMPVAAHIMLSKARSERRPRMKIIGLAPNPIA